MLPSGRNYGWSGNDILICKDDPTEQSVTCNLFLIKHFHFDSLRAVSTYQRDNKECFCPKIRVLRELSTHFLNPSKQLVILIKEDKEGKTSI